MNTALLPFPTPNSIPHSALNTPHSLGSTFPVPHSALAPRRTGKVARLPKATRDRINRMLDENVPYHTIIAELGEAGQDLNPQNISNWAQGGYQDYLRHQDMLDLLKDQVEFAKDLLAQVPDPGALFQALRLMAGVQLSRVLFETGQKLAETDPAAYGRLVQNICNLSRAERQYCQARLKQAPVASAPAKPIDYFRPLTDRETQLIRAKLDEMCGYSDEPASPIKPDQGAVELRFQRAGQGGFQPPVPVESASNPIKVDQASTPTTAATPPLGADAQKPEFKVPSSTFEVQGSPAQPELPPAPPAASPIKVDQASAQNIAAATSLGADAQSPEFQVPSSTFEVQGSPTQPELAPAQPAATPIKSNQASSVVEAAISAAATPARTPGPR